MEALITNLDRTAHAFESDIQIEQERIGIHDPAHLSYSTHAKAMIARYDNLKQSVNGLKYHMATVKAGLAEAHGNDSQTRRLSAATL
jgi:hypothetical protein